jgi:hypothetical protein
MTDDPTVRPRGPGPDEAPDRRDDSLAALLAVPPLDEHTRRRLVRRALDTVPASTARRRRPALLLGAAAGLLAVAVAVGVLLTGGGGTPAPQAARRAAPRQPAIGPVAPGAAVAPPRDLGPVGDVTTVALLRRVVDGPAGPPGASLARIRGGCGTRAPGGVTRPELVGVGVDAGRPAGIVVGRDAAGHRTAVVVALDRCALLQRLPLG